MIFTYGKGKDFTGDFPLFLIAYLSCLQNKNQSTNNTIAYRQVSNISRTLVGNEIVDHSDVVGASPVGAAPITSSFSTQRLASIYCAKTMATRDGKHLSWGIWCAVYYRFYGICISLCTCIQALPIYDHLCKWLFSKLSLHFRQVFDWHLATMMRSRLSIDAIIAHNYTWKYFAGGDSHSLNKDLWDLRAHLTTNIWLQYCGLHAFPCGYKVLK